MSSSPANLGASAIRLSGGQLITRVISFLWIAYFSRAAGPVHFGIYTTVMSFYGLAVPLANLGTGTSVMRDASKDHARGPALFGSLFWIRTVLTLVLSLLILGSFRWYGYSFSYWPLFVWGAFYFVLTGWGQIAEAVYVVHHKTTLLWASQLVTALLWAISGFFAWRYTQRMDAVFIGLAGSALVTDILHARLLTRDSLWPLFSINKPLIHDQIVRSAPISMVSVLTLASERVDRILLSWKNDPAIVGYFGLASMMVLTTVEVVWHPFITVLYSILNRAAAGPEATKSLRWIAAKGTLWSLAAALPLVAALWFFAPALIRHFWGDRYLAAIPILKVFSCVLPFFAYNKILANFLLADHRDRAYLKINIGLFALYFVGNIILIPRYGALGAAAVMVVSHALATLAYMIAVNRFLPRFWRSDGFLPLVVSAVVCFLPLLLWQGPRAWGLLPFILFGGLVYRFVFSTEDRSIAQRWVEHLSRRHG